MLSYHMTIEGNTLSNYVSAHPPIPTAFGKTIQSGLFSLYFFFVYLVFGYHFQDVLFSIILIKWSSLLFSFMLITYTEQNKTLLRLL